ncbi:UNVERIFIED_CONTAM: hypothetical protein FKN15_025218 [Acipenser sinensis]
MSLGRLLRRASSKASDLLIFNPGSGGSRSVLDGEIIYSKNNVCVHPSELLQGLAEHHPGYLCIHMEKDEFLGTTLVLTWVPNSRIQRQDEEALRYITPESSPVRKAPRRRGRHTQGHGRAQAERREPMRIGEAEQILSVSPRVTDPVHLADTPSLETSSTHTTHSDSGILSTISSASGEEEELPGDGAPGEDEGSCDLSADDVSRDSTMGSDSDTLSSPFCLSPISEALGESSSVFLDNESRETCDDPMTRSASSASSLDNNASFLENSSQSQNSKWEEQQKVLALEQLCGVFRIDLGQMRSLRLFFSDEACTSGQLVIASRESQYKIFHFHHGGLDKLAEVFQKWKCCRETQLKDQVADEKSCMQFSIRPNLPSTETHPEENMYKRLDVSTWLKHLNETGQVEEEYKLRKTDYFHLFICVAIIVIYGDDVIEQQLATDQMLLHFSNLAMHMNGEIVLRKARSLLYQFRLLPRVPCSLHDLCKLCGPGMWDSRYIPAVECSGNHPGSESCPYGGTVEVPSPKQARDGKKGSKTRDIFNFRKQS